MIEIIKSKGMLCFVLFIVGICYLSANNINSQISMEEGSNNNLVVINEN